VTQTCTIVTVVAAETNCYSWLLPCSLLRAPTLLPSMARAYCRPALLASWRMTPASRRDAPPNHRTGVRVPTWLPVDGTANPRRAMPLAAPVWLPPNDAHPWLPCHGWPSQHQASRHWPLQGAPREASAQPRPQPAPVASLMHFVHQACNSTGFK